LCWADAAVLSCAAPVGTLLLLIFMLELEMRCANFTAELG